MIYDGAGGECTPMFESYHPLYLTKQGPPQKYYIGDVRDYHDFYSWDGKFYDKLKERVEKAIIIIICCQSSMLKKLLLNKKIIAWC